MFGPGRVEFSQHVLAKVGLRSATLAASQGPSPSIDLFYRGLGRGRVRPTYFWKVFGACLGRPDGFGG